MSSRGPSYSFGPYVLDVREHRLLRNGEPIPLSKRPMAVLVALVEHAGQLVTKEHLLDRAWADCIVEENALSVAVSRLRRSLGATSDGSVYIETVPGLGYRFAAPVSRVDSGADERMTTPRDAADAFGAHVMRAASFRSWTLWWSPAGLSLLGGVLLVLTAGTFVWGPAVLVEMFSSRAVEPTVEVAPPEPDASPEAVARRRSASDAYRRGRELLATRRPGEEALRSFYLARAIDSTYAPAYLGIAESYAMGHRTHFEALAMAEHALRLDPDLGEAYAVLGFIHAFQRWDWPAAEAAFAKARTRAPRHVRTHQWHAAYLLVQRRFAEAEAAIDRALALDPRSPNLHADLCEIHIAQRDLSAANDACDRARSLDPTFPFTKDHLFFLRLLEGRPEAAIQSYPQLPPLPEGSLPPRATAEKHLLTLARHAEALDPPPLYTLARLQAALGDEDAALRTLEAMLDQRAFHLPFAHADPIFDGIRSTDRFRAIMRAIGLEEQSGGTQRATTSR